MIRVGSDFSGVGAFDQALIRLGIDYKTVFACDMDKYARITYKENYGEPEYYPLNVYDREIPKESLDIYMTSPPCQSFSLAGKRKGEDSDNGILFYNSHDFIKKNKPRFFIFENVKGLLSDDCGKTFAKWCDYLGGKSMNGNPVIFPHEESTPYHIYFKVLNAKHYGVPQNRERIFIIGIRDDQDNNFHFPKPIHLVKRLKDVLEDDVEDKFYLSEKMVKYFTDNQKGKGNGRATEFLSGDEQHSACLLSTYYKTPKDGIYLKVKSATKKGFEVAYPGDSINFSQPNSQPNSQTRRGRVGKEVAQTLDTSCNQGIIVIDDKPKENVVVVGNLKGGKWDKTHEQSRRVYGTNGVSPTINTMGGGNQEPKIKIQGGMQKNAAKMENISPCLTSAMGLGGGHIPFMTNYQIRKLTPRECFRLMDFPDTFKISKVSNSQAYKQAGNSIVVNVLAELIKKLNL